MLSDKFTGYHKVGFNIKVNVGTQDGIIISFNFICHIYSICVFILSSFLVM